MHQIVRLNDIGDHGSKVITASGDVFCEGIAVARKNDFVDCPIPGHGVNQIINASSSVFVNGRPVAVKVAKSQCGSNVGLTKAAVKTYASL